MSLNVFSCLTFKSVLSSLEVSREIGSKRSNPTRRRSLWHRLLTLPWWFWSDPNPCWGWIRNTC